jgi:hypothetical protein
MHHLKWEIILDGVADANAFNKMATVWCASEDHKHLA